MAVCICMFMHRNGPLLAMISHNYVTGFWKITHVVATEIIRIFEISMALLIAETTFKNISKLYF